VKQFVRVFVHQGGELRSGRETVQEPTGERRGVIVCTRQRSDRGPSGASAVTDSLWLLTVRGFSEPKPDAA
jgi:hypothetical protein